MHMAWDENILPNITPSTAEKVALELLLPGKIIEFDGEVAAGLLLVQTWDAMSTRTTLLFSSLG